MENNTHKSLKQLAVINSWFDPVEDTSDRYSLHTNVAFSEERLGGEPESEVHFRVSLLRCEVVVVLPEIHRALKADPRTVAMTAPRSAATQSRTKTRKQSGGFAAKIGLSKKSPTAELDASYEKSGEEVVQTQDTQAIQILSTLHGQSKDGHHCWRVTGDIEGALNGSLWNAVNEPRFHVIDQRSDRSKKIDQENALPPVATVEVRCLREDIRVFDIKYKNEYTEQISRGREGQQNRLRAAESYIRSELLREGLRVGELSDLFSELTLSEMLVPLHD